MKSFSTSFFYICSLSAMCITAVGCHWDPVIQTSARIGSLWVWPGRFPYSHCGRVPLRPSDTDFSQNWKPVSVTREMPLLSLRSGAIETQWYRLQPELEACECDQGDSPTITAVGCHWDPVIQTSARIGSHGPGRCPYSFQIIAMGLFYVNESQAIHTPLDHGASLSTLPRLPCLHYCEIIIFPIWPETWFLTISDLAQRHTGSL
jgi:hypothetical protein